MAANTDKQPRRKGGLGRPWKPGESGNPTGRPKAILEIERMLDAEHRTVPNMREVYARLKELAMGEPIEIRDKRTGELVRVELRAHPGFMEIYLNRVQGPIQQIKADLSDAPPEVLNWLVEHLN